MLATEKRDNLHGPTLQRHCSAGFEFVVANLVACLHLVATLRHAKEEEAELVFVTVVYIADLMKVDSKLMVKVGSEMPMVELAGHCTY
jgi:hypothetical protein